MTRDDARARGGRLKQYEEDTRYSSASKGTTTGSPRSHSDGAAALFTPGPWRGDSLGLKVYALDPYGHGDMNVADLRGWGHLTGTGACHLADDAAIAIQKANAHLIAAAPELLKEAKAVLAQFDAGYFVRNTNSDGCSDWAIKALEPLRALSALKAAVQKADGRPAPTQDQEA